MKSDIWCHQSHGPEKHQACQQSSIYHPCLLLTSSMLLCHRHSGTDDGSMYHSCNFMQLHVRRGAAAIAAIVAFDLQDYTTWSSYSDLGDCVCSAPDAAGRFSLLPVSTVSCPQVRAAGRCGGGGSGVRDWSRCPPSHARRCVQQRRQELHPLCVMPAAVLQPVQPARSKWYHSGRA